MKGKAARAEVLHAEPSLSPAGYGEASPRLDIPAPLRSRHASAVIGQIKFYDESTAWGVIQGADGGLYAMRGDQLTGSRPEVGDRVVFEVQPAPGGPRAISIRRTRGD